MSPLTQLSKLNPKGHPRTLFITQLYIKPTSFRGLEIHSSRSPQLHCLPRSWKVPSSCPSSCSPSLWSHHFLLLFIPSIHHPEAGIIYSSDVIMSLLCLTPLAGRHCLHYKTPHSIVCWHSLRQNPNLNQPTCQAEFIIRLLDGVTDPRGRTEARTKDSNVLPLPLPSLLLWT